MTPQNGDVYHLEEATHLITLREADEIFISQYLVPLVHPNR